MFHHPDRHFTDYEERLLWSTETPWSWGYPALGYDQREAIRGEARRLQHAAFGRWLGTF